MPGGPVGGWGGGQYRGPTMRTNDLTVPAGTRVVRPFAEPRPRAGAAAPAGGAAAWTPPPLPTGSYNPQRDVEVQESQRGLGQLQDELGTARTRATSDYYTQEQEIGRREGQQAQDYQRAKDLLGQSYARLAARQQEQANQAGVIGGGALLQSAAARAANQGQAQSSADVNRQRQQEANMLQLAKLAREAAPPDATNPVGGRQFQDLLTKLTNAQSNATFFREAQERLEGQEAAERGYVQPGPPAASRPAPSPHPLVRAFTGPTKVVNGLTVPVATRTVGPTFGRGRRR